MTDKELAEIRRRYKPDKTSISRVRGCYVNDKNEIVAEFDQSLGLMSEDEVEFILGLLKKSVSGANGKNIFDVAFTNQQVVDGAEHNRLMQLRDTAIASDDDVHALYESIIRLCISTRDILFFSHTTGTTFIRMRATAAAVRIRIPCFPT